MTEAGARLAQVFATIHRERMRGLPVVNAALEVATVGFDEGPHERLGVLITPWCMNLVLLPPEDGGVDAEAGDWAALKPGAKQAHVLPSGTYEFVVADEPGVGRFQSCSLFSPMFEFGDQATAVATAKAVLLAIMDKAYSEPMSAGQSLTRDPDKPTLAERARGPLSRRDFLRGEAFR
ncbi:MAG: [NiFe]-hydrogenase assembly chaperone HybE [Gammaproteobacteria bacterium]|nr:[NiFe]-hydrogenase assembly chaperone HybE [Gammaproteobacteria bacterium]